MTHMVCYGTYLDNGCDEDALEIENCRECIFNKYSDNKEYTGKPNELHFNMDCYHPNMPEKGRRITWEECFWDFPDRCPLRKRSLRKKIIVKLK